MDVSNIVLSIISIIGTVSSVLFAYLAFARNKQNDTKKDATDIAGIKIDVKYTRDSVNRIERRLDEYEHGQSNVLERIAKLEEHQSRTDGRLDKLERRA